MSKDKFSRAEVTLEIAKKLGISGDNFAKPTHFQETAPSLIEQTVRHWSQKNDEERTQYYDQIDENYHSIVDEFFDQADNSAGRYQKFSNKHIHWGKKMMWLTGGIAIINVVLFYTSGQGQTDFPEDQYPIIRLLFALLPLFAAVYAAFIAIFGKLDTLQNYFDRAQANREVREVFLNEARKYEMFWHVYVRPFGNSAKACTNAAKLYRQITLTDQVIRGQAKEISQAKRPEGAQSGKSV